jgi:hypothetical protein
MKQVLRALLALLLAVPVAAYAIGAIAVDDPDGDTEPGWGVSTGHATRDEARRAALQECRKAGNEKCKVVVWFDKCGAYASSKTHYGVGWGATKAIAERIAREKCEDASCKVIVSECE